MSEYFRQAEPNQIVQDYPIGNEFWPKFGEMNSEQVRDLQDCLLYTSPSPRDS